MPKAGLASTSASTATPAHASLGEFAMALALLMVGLTLLVVVLLSRQRPWVILLQVLPVVISSFVCSGGVGLWLLRATAPSAGRLLAAGCLAGLTGATLAMAVLASAWGRSLGDVLGRALVVKGLMVGPLLGAMVCLVLLVLARWRQAEFNAWEIEAAHRVQHERLQRERTLADLRLLQAQLEPHFLYNTLANLRQLIRIDSQRALTMLEQLIRYFKLVLPSFAQERVPLDSEVALVRAYVELFRERMQPAPELTLSVPSDVRDQAVLPGSVLCLVENAMKHGRPINGIALQLQVSALHVGDRLQIEVRDNGPGLGTRSDTESTGTGLRNLQDRLRLSYDTLANLALRQDDLGCIATLDLPWEAPQ
ncbi:MAG: histidine kinase [Rhodoferax sp.]